jgi:hypothetical protein
MLCASATPASARLNNRAATHAYLSADYAYEQAVVLGEPSAQRAVEAAANNLGAECSGVLANAPQESPYESFLDGSRKTARQRGETSRQNRQLGELGLEMTLYLALTEAEALHEPRLVFAQKVAQLRWSDAQLTRRVHEEASNSVNPPFEVPGVCADMRAWVASGYRSLPPNTKTVIRKFATLARSERDQPPTESLLTRYEGPSEKTLVHKIEVQKRLAERGSQAYNATFKRIYAALGFVTHDHEPFNGPPKGSVRLGGGKTAVGSKYTVWLEPPSDRQDPGCRARVTLIDATSSSYGICISGAHAQSDPNVECDSGSSFTTQALLTPATRLVRMRLSNGKQISSRPVIVPARLGGPIALYYQVTRGPTPLPVSLTEIGVHGKKLRTLKLPRAECATGPEFLPPRRTLAHGQIPGGADFAIVGQRYRIFKHIAFELNIEMHPEALAIEGGGVDEGSVELRSRKGPFQPRLSTGCHPHEYSIVYGVLDAAHDTVEARVGTKLYRLHHVKIPQSLHVGPGLAYIALDGVPDKVIVRSPDGKIVQTEDLSTRAKETRETCEGESEEPSPP